MAKIEKVQQEAIVQICLEALYRIREESPEATVTNVSFEVERLLEADGLSEHSEYGKTALRRLEREYKLVDLAAGVYSLNRRGVARVDLMVRRRRLMECLLVQVLGMDMERASVEAKSLESGMSEGLCEVIAELLDQPAMSPYGYGIPGQAGASRAGSMPRGSCRLGDAEVGQEMAVLRVPYDEGALLEYLLGQGVRPGAVLVIRDKGAISGIISFDVGERQSAIGAHIGERIWLRPLEAEVGVDEVGELDSEDGYRPVEDGPEEDAVGGLGAEELQLLRDSVV